MNPEEKELLRRSLALGEENQKMLLKIQKILHWQAVWSVVKILIIIVPFVLGYLFFQPYIDPLFNSYKDVQGTTNEAQGTNKSSGEFIKDLLQELN